jgi:hypothetical protein
MAESARIESEVTAGPIPPLDQPSRRVLWYSLLSGPIIYMVYFLIAWLVTEFACEGNGLTFNVGPLNGVAFVLVLLTAVALIALLASAAIAWQAWRRRSGPNAPVIDVDDMDGADPVEVAEGEDIPDGTGGMMALTGFGLNLLFAAVTLLSAIPGFVLVACDWV